ncbi:LytR/AlgR family response regulator transcription factor [Taibaiella koreensis]|uniref:LytR/AlgR family response regulator transcription factor n=1 Tax=Taibaiella koreensis TaxID=1268548 RepID=UPI000E59A067|nr:LytTR family DNA-binding domain-containing protein [Taibaiella koreensis]
MIKAILIDDEPHALELLAWQLKQYCPGVTVAALCYSADEGIAAIKAHQPQLIFLDIEMPHKNGFDVIRAFPDPVFDIIFITAYNEFALQAFRAAALDYLLKPIDSDDLMRSIARHEKKQLHQQLKDQLQQLLLEYKPAKPPIERVSLSTADGIIFVSPHEITRAEASGNYCIIFFTDKHKLLMAKTLKGVEELLADYGFIRIHQSHLVNIACIAKYSKNDGGIIFMKDGTQLPVSRQRKDELTRLFGPIY